MAHKPADLPIVASGHTSDDLDRQIYEANAFINEGIDSYVFIANRFAKHIHQFVLLKPLTADD